jgi:phenylpropionate dioxygenase-like ring-hydroxylating dioxygenase large terminal subunit
MLKNFWYACEFSSAITNKPKQIKLLRQNFVLYRNAQGQVIALNDRCPHRGAAISQGSIDRDCIRCPYHGWKFRTDGTCIEIPANSEGELIPPKARLDAYPAQEKYGFVWLFWGDLSEEERPPLLSFPEVKDSTLRSVQSEFRWNAHYSRVVDNSIDLVHSPFVHPNSFGSGMAQDPQFPECDFHQGRWSGSISLHLKQPLPKGFLWNYIDRMGWAQVAITQAFYMPNLVSIDIANGKLIVMLAQVPLDNCTTVTKMIQFRSFLTQPLFDGIFHNQNLQINQEDRRIVEAQQPEVVPSDLIGELHMHSDVLSIAYRKMRKKCLDMGWVIDRPDLPIRIQETSNHHPSLVSDRHHC